MRVSTCVALAIAIGLSGLVLRRVVPVSPADDAFRETVRFYEGRREGGP